MSEADRTPFDIRQARDLVRSARENLLIARDHFSKAAAATSGTASGRFSQEAWEAFQMANGTRPQWFSQAGQDFILDRHIFSGKRDGVFVDVGAYDGITGSNTAAFEFFRGWTGLLIEPSPSRAEQARLTRQSQCLEIAVADRAGTAEFVDIEKGYTQMSGLLASYDGEMLQKVRANAGHAEKQISVTTETLASVLSRLGEQRIDLVSMDIEGGELAALRKFPFDQFHISAWVIENSGENQDLRQLMFSNGYRLRAFAGVDEIYDRQE